MAQKLFHTKCMQGLLSRATGIMLLYSSVAALEKPLDEWQIRENLVTRLGGEWYKINVLKKELNSMQEIIQEMRDIELFPPEITGLRDESLFLFDKKLELFMKKHQALSEQVEALRPPLIDAMAILREMVVGRPVEDMFQVLDNDDIRRISVMFEIKHHIDSLWKDFDGLFHEIGAALKISTTTLRESRQGPESEFFQILKANLGLQSRQFCNALDEMKDTLFIRGSDDLRMRMFQVEVRRVKQFMKSGDFSSVKKTIEVLNARYRERRFIDECNKMLVQGCFAGGEFEEMLRIKSQLPDSVANLPEIAVYEVKSLSLLKRYNELWKWATMDTVRKYGGSFRNLLIWLTMESGLALGKTDDVIRIASLAIKDSSYSLHILHCLGRLYCRSGDWGSAQSVFESALRQKVQRKVDEEAYRRIQLSLAHLQYECGHYQKALPIFINLLSHEQSFAEALFGISWCYIALDDYPKAETSLRKLINQRPWSPLSAEALSITMQRFVAAAKAKWDKCLYLSNEELRLVKKLNVCMEKLGKSDATKTVAEHTLLVSKIDDLLGLLKREKRASYEEIRSCYRTAFQIAKLISAHYETGTFQEISFTEKREKLLRRLDSLLILTKELRNTATNESIAFLQSMKDVAAIKEIVRKSKVAAVVARIDAYRWEREYRDWQKTNVKREQDDMTREISATQDSIRCDAFRLRYKRCGAVMDSLALAGDSADDQWRGSVIQSCIEVLRGKLDSADEAYIRYHLGETYYGLENEKYNDAFAVYEERLVVHDSLVRLFREGSLIEMPVRPAEPLIDHRASREQFGVVLTKFPNSVVAHAVHYGLAWCYNDEAQFDSAMTHMQKLVNGFPASQYVPQAWMYIGEYMFDHSKLDSALKAYQAVLKYPESEWFDKALYKLAWTQYRLLNPEKAIGSFLALVDLGAGSRSGKSLLEKESIDYIAISFSETDVTGEKGLQRATNFVKRFGDPSKGAQILHRMAAVFKEQGRFEMAQKTFAMLLRIYPENKSSPVIEAELLAVLEKSSSIEQANIGRLEFFNKYNKNGDWAKMQKDSATRKSGDSLSCKMLYDAALSYHQLALQKNDTAVYTQAAENYQKFIQLYPLSSKAGECHYNLAEIMFSLGEYEKAAEEYMAVSKRYPGSQYKETAAWNAIVASQNLLKKESAAVR